MRRGVAPVHEKQGFDLQQLAKARQGKVHAPASAEIFERLERGEDVGVLHHIRKAGNDVFHLVAKLGHLCSLLDDEAHPQTELTRVQHGDGDAGELIRRDARRVDGGAQLLRNVDRENGAGTCVGQFVPGLHEDFRAGRGGAGRGVKGRKQAVELFARQVHAVEVGLVSLVDVYRYDGNAMLFDDRCWQVTSAISDNANIHVHFLNSRSLSDSLESQS